MSATQLRRLTLLAVFVTLTNVATAQWSGTGTEADPYLVSDAAGLNAIGANSAQWDKQFKLTADIDLAGAGITPAIGTFTEGFAGVLDGAGFEIQNLASNQAGVVVLNWGTVRDLTVRNGQLTQVTSVTAGMIANQNAGLIVRCKVEGGNVSGAALAGGVVGDNLRSGRVYACRTSCTVTSARGSFSLEDAGGIAGRNSYQIFFCASSATVVGEGQNGGIVGYNDSHVRYCYATGTAQRDADFGGIAGYNRSRIAHCYSTATAEPGVRVRGIVSTNDANYGSVTASFWDTEVTGITADDGGATGLTTAEMQTAAAFEGASWEFAGNSARPLWFIPDGGGYPLGWWERDPVEVPSFGGGSGTAADPYQIATPAHWGQIGRRFDLLDANYRVTADLDFTGVTDPAAGSGHTPFTGTFDGGGHTVSNLFISDDVPCGSGLIPNANGAGIRDLHFASPTVEATGSYAGPLVGYALDTTVSGITVDKPTVDGRANLGGVLGHLRGGSLSDCAVTGGAISGPDNGLGGSVGGLVGNIGSGTTVDRCTASATVSGRNDVGGLIGDISGTFIVVSDCAASGDVSGLRTVGGFTGAIVGGGLGDDVPGRARVFRSSATGNVIATDTNDTSTGGFVGTGNGGSCHECFATGDVTAAGHGVGGFLGSKYRGIPYSDCYARGNVTGARGVGGFVGQYYPDRTDNDFQRCYSTGTVSGSGALGGFIGEFTSANDIPITDSFWDRESSGVGTSASGIGLWGAAMRSRESFAAAGWDFDQTWTIAYGSYPRLQWEVGQLFNDSDGDGLPDEWEAEHFGDNEAADSDADPDEDGLDNAAEYRNGTDPHNANSDGDAIDDLEEVAQGADPNDAASTPGLAQRLLSDTPGALEQFGYDVAISGDTVVVGAPGRVPNQLQREFDEDEFPGEILPGSAQVFRREMTASGARWVRLTKLEPSDPDDLGFGTSVDIDGDTVAIGCWTPAAYVFDLNVPADGGVRFDVTPDPSEGFTVAATTDVAIDGDTVVIGAPFDSEGAHLAGAVYVYRRDDEDVWDMSTKLLQPAPKVLGRLGIAVDIHGGVIAAGTGPYHPNQVHGIFPSDGSVFMFRRDDAVAGGWEFEDEVRPPSRLRNVVYRIGSQVSLSRDALAVSGINSNNDGDYESAASAVFEREPDGFEEWRWSQVFLPDVDFGTPGDRCWCYEGPFKVALQHRTLLIGTTRGVYVRQRAYPDEEAYVEGFGEPWLLSRHYYPSTLTTAPPGGGGPFGAAVALSGAFMAAGAPASESAWVTAVHEPAPYDEWVARFFTDEYLELPFAAPGEDPDFDGLTNLLELALGFEPSTPDEGPGAAAGIPVDTTDGGGQQQHMTLTFSLPEPPPAEVSYSVEASPGQVVWESIVNRSPDGVWTGTATVTEQIGSDGRLQATVHDTAPISAGDTRSLRIRVSIP